MEKEYFYLNGEVKVGPLSLEALKFAPVTPETLVWNNTMPDWAEAGKLPELENVFAPAPAVPPPPSVSAPPPPYQAQPGFGTGGAPSQNVAPPMPDNYLVWAILTTILCCLPLGIVSILNASKVSSLYASGDYEGAQKASADAKKWAMWGAIGGGIGIVLYLVLMFALGLGAAFADL
jgi:hypothetical protein